MLGQIEFEPWQCLGELIDNAIDAFIDAERAGHPVDAPRIEIVLPTAEDLQAGSARVEVIDNAAGMTIDRLQDCVRAGYSGNDPMTKLGLFGMGFNVSTARLGKRTEVFTTRAGDAEWIGVRIDFDELEKRGTFDAPVIPAPKAHPTEQGTRVRITRLDNLRHGDEKRGLAEKLSISTTKSQIRRTLGHVYSRFITDKKLTLVVAGTRVEPERPCVWGETRAVTRDGERIAAVMPIDEHLGHSTYCISCWRWLAADEAVCDNCGSSISVVKRERRIRGWIGIQRYFDQDHYGIDFVRNGRKILTRYKDVFKWVDPDTGRSEIEYPIDFLERWGGRIVGEIEIDHVRVSYKKDAFDSSDPGWFEVLRVLRGDGPLQPKKYAQLYPKETNHSYLAKLYKGFRRSDPGTNYLVPGRTDPVSGDVKADNEMPKRFVEKFAAGDPVYQSDEKWYDLVLEAERGIRSNKAKTTAASAGTASSPGALAGGVVGELLGGIGGRAGAAPPGIANGTAAPAAQASPRPDDPMALYLRRSVKDAARSHEYRVDGLDVPAVNLTVYRQQTGADSLAVRLFTKASHDDTLFYDPGASAFREWPDEPDDLILLELAGVFRTFLGNSEKARMWPLSRVYEQLRRQYRGSERIDPVSVSQRARSLLRDLQSAGPDLISSDPARAARVLSKGEEEYIAARILHDFGRGADMVRELLGNGKFVEVCPFAYLPRLVREWPAPFLDGCFWDVPYEDVFPNDQEAASRMRRETADRVANYLADVVWLVDRLMAGEGGPHFKTQLIRASRSLDLLEAQRKTD